MVYLHLGCALLSYAAFLIAFVSGALFLAQEWQLKHKRMGMLFHQLPALGTLEWINVWALTAGFGLLSAGLGVGLLQARVLFGHWWRWDPKELLAVALWSAYLGLVLVRFRVLRRGRKVAMLSILGFTFVLLSYLGANHWLPSWHPRAAII